MKSVETILSICVLNWLLFPGCNKSNNVLLGRVEAKVGAYTVIVTDCYRTDVPPPQRLQDTHDGKPAYCFTPCKDADIRILGTKLIVNGKTYGNLKHGDIVAVDHGRVLINDVEANKETDNTSVRD